MDKPEEQPKRTTRRTPRAAEDFRIVRAPQNKRERKIAERIRECGEQEDFVAQLRAEEARNTAAMQAEMTTAGFSDSLKGQGQRTRRIPGAQRKFDERHPAGEGPSR